MGLIALACIVGTLVKQDTSTAAAASGRGHGSLAAIFGLHRLYSTWWFLGLLALFAVSTTACALSRLRFRLRSLGPAMVHLSLIFIVAGVIVRGFAAQDGYVAIRKGETVDSFKAEGKTVPFGFRLRLDDFEVRRHADASEALLMKFSDDPKTHTVPFKIGQEAQVRPDGTTIEVLRYLPDFRMPMVRGGQPYSASNEPNNPAIQVRLTGPADDETRWLFIKYPGIHAESARKGGPLMQYVRLPGSVDAFESRVTVSDESGRPPRTGSILVNQPLRAGRFTLYQVSYDEETETRSTLEAVYDPGVPLVFTGFILMPAGIAFVFYVQPLLKRRRARSKAPPAHALGGRSSR